MGHAPVMIEILPFIKGVEFDDAWQRRVEIVIDRATGLTAFVLSREDLITAKLARISHREVRADWNRRKKRSDYAQVEKGESSWSFLE